ncbi:MAG: hypothetical protein ACYTCU_05035, partial [Planctomycetota bacterium]
YLPHIPKLDAQTLTEEGYEIVTTPSGVLHSMGDKDLYPAHGVVDLTGDAGGCTVAFKQMPYFWPAALEMWGTGDVVAGVFTTRNNAPYTFVWRQHESRTVAFDFHAGAAFDVVRTAQELDMPLVGRAADYDHYDEAEVLPYQLLTEAEQNWVYSAMGVNHTVYIKNEKLEVTRFLSSGQTGGANNHDSIERQLFGEWLRHGHGGQFLDGMDLAVYKSEWQILRSDNFHHENDPGAINDSLPHSEKFEGDLEHRYRHGMILAYYLTGDPRIKDALYDEAEILEDLFVGEQERSMYQSMTAQALVGEFTDSAEIRAALKNRIQFFCTPTMDVTTGLDGFGWESIPGSGNRRYYVWDGQGKAEKQPGENYVTRGFITASLGPIGMYHASRWLGLSDPDGALARGRLADQAWYTRHELYPWDPNPVTRRMVYSYGVKQKFVNSMEQSVFHPILLGMGEAYLSTGDTGYMWKAVEQVENFKAVDQGGYSDNMYLIDSRLDCQHFFAIYAAWLGLDT